MELITSTRLKIVLVVFVMIVLVVTGTRLLGQHENSREAACRRSAAEVQSSTQGISVDAAICNGTIKPGNPQ